MRYLILAICCFVAACVTVNSRRAVAGTLTCDVNGDGKVDTVDLQLIRAHSGETVPPGDPKYDANGDGRIDVADVRFCQLRCTNASCAP